jgi:hypothetical protein
MIELKLVWSGYGTAMIFPKIYEDLRKLGSRLSSSLTSEAHMVLLDGLDRNFKPYFSTARIYKMLVNLKLRPTLSSRLHLWHWPDSDEPVDKVTQAPWKHYTAYV